MPADIVRRLNDQIQRARYLWILRASFIVWVEFQPDSFLMKKLVIPVEKRRTREIIIIYPSVL